MGNKIKKFTAATVCFAILVVLFQNCAPSGGFSTIASTASSASLGQGSQTNEPAPNPAPEPAPAPAPTPQQQPPNPQPAPQPMPQPVPNPQPNPMPQPLPSPVPNPQPTPVPVPNPAPAPSAFNLYVSPNGSDTNAGTEAAPFKTIQKAASASKAGTTIHVAPGAYTGGITSSAVGTATARIRYVSTTRWGAKINAGSKDMIWTVNGGYTDIDGFEMNGSGSNLNRIGIYLNGGNSTVRNNWIHHIGLTTPCTNNGGAGIVVDNSRGLAYRNYDLVGNVVHHVGTSSCKFIQGIYHSSTGSIKNNLVYQIGNAAIHLWHDSTNLDIINNTVFGSNYGIIVGGGDYYHNAARKADYVNVQNNLVYDNKYGIAEMGDCGTNNTYLNNLSVNNPGYDYSLWNKHSGDVVGDPQFVNYNRNGGGDYRLKSASPAINKGLSTYAPKTDLNGVARPLGGGIDVGAYENY